MSRLRNAGALRTPLALEEPFTSDDTGGGFDQTWMGLGTIWAQIRTASAMDARRAEHYAGQVTHRIQVRRDSQQPIRSGMRFVSAFRIFRILAVHDPDETGAMLICLAEEVER